MKIPKKMAHIWIGPKEPPLAWMETWKTEHPEWEYTLYDQHYLDNSSFRTARQIKEYINRGQYAGVADLMRYEILYEEGGYIAAADSICLQPIDPLFDDGKEIYTVYENEFVRGELVSPVSACVPRHPFIKTLIDELENVDPLTMQEPWKETGNLFVAQMIKIHRPDITIWPSHYFIPNHYTGVTYNGDGPIFAKQMFGTTNDTYVSKTLSSRFLNWKRRKYYKRIKQKLRQRS